MFPILLLPNVWMEIVIKIKGCLGRPLPYVHLPLICIVSMWVKHLLSLSSSCKFSLSLQVIFLSNVSTLVLLWFSSGIGVDGTLAMVSGQLQDLCFLPVRQ